MTDREKVDLRGFLTILRDRWSLIALVTVLVLSIAIVYLVLATRSYSAVTSLLIDTRPRSAVSDPATAVIGSSPDAVLVESQVRLISSDAVLRRVVTEQNLAEDPEFTPTGPGLRTRLLALVGITRAPSAQDKVAQATLNLASHVVVTRSERTYIADIEVTSTDPLKAARLAGAVAEAYLADQQAARDRSAERDSDWLREQVGEMQKGLQDAEVNAEAYKRDHGIIGANGKLLNEQELADASAGLSQAINRATEVKARLDQIKKVTVSGGNLDALPEALKSTTIDKLRGQYADVSRQQATLRQTLGDRHPALLESQQQLRDIRRLISEELSRVQAGIANEYQTAQANVAAQQSQVDALKKAAVISNADRVRLDELQRDVDARRAVYDRFLRARDTVREQAVDAPIGRIIAPARIPVSPSSPKTFAVLALSLASGLGLGVALALVADLLRGPARIRPLLMISRNVVDEGPAPPPEQEFSTPVLGYVPSPFGNSATLSSRDWLLDRSRTAWPTAIETEHVPSLPAFRTAIQALALDTRPDGAGSEKPRTLLVTSMGDADGRTAFSLGLAEAAAGHGKRAVVIDADEDGSLLRDLVTTTARPTLIDLMGTARICYRIVAPFRGRFSIVPIMAGEAQIVRRLGAQGAAARIDGISNNFDLVVFDGPRMSRAGRLDAMAATVDAVIVIAPKTATRDDIDQAVANLELPQGSTVAAVLVSDFTEGAATSAAA